MAGLSNAPYSGISRGARTSGVNRGANNGSTNGINRGPQVVWGCDRLRAWHEAAIVAAGCGSVEREQQLGQHKGC